MTTPTPTPNTPDLARHAASSPSPRRPYLVPNPSPAHNGHPRPKPLKTAILTPCFALLILASCPKSPASPQTQPVSTPSLLSVGGLVTNRCQNTPQGPRLHFALRDLDGHPIPQDTLLDSGTPLTPDAITITLTQTQLHLDDPQSPSCQPGQCPQGFTCQPPNTTCTQSATITASAPTPDSLFGQPSQPPHIAIAIDNGGALAGLYPQDLDQRAHPDLATDPDQFRISAVRTLTSDMRRNPALQDARIALWSFDSLTPGENGAVALTGTTFARPSQPYQTLSNWTDDTPNVLNTLSPKGRSNVHDAIFAISDHFGFLCEISARCDPQQRGLDLIILTDGPDDATTDAPDQAQTLYQQRLQQALDTAAQFNVRVHIVHLDTGFSPELAATLEPDTHAFPPHPRNAQGRTGPLDLHDHIACATGGQHLYITAPAALPDAMRTLGHTLGGGWRTTLQLPQPNAHTDIPWRLSTTVNVTIGTQTLTARLAQDGHTTATQDTAASDNRPIVFW